MCYGSAMAPGRAADALDALGDANRRAVLEIVAEGPVPVHVIADRLPISRPAVSRHLRVLKDAGLVEDEAVGVERVYRVREAGVESLRAYFESLWGEAFTRFRIVTESRPARGRRRG